MHGYRAQQESGGATGCQAAPRTARAGQDIVLCTAYRKSTHEHLEDDMAEGRFFGRLLSGLHKTRQALKESLGTVFSRKRIDAETLEELEEALILADLGVLTTEKVLQEVNQRVKQKTIEAGEGLRDGVVETLRDILLAATPPSSTDMALHSRPWVLMMVGVNGVGKTTTLGKLAYQWRTAGE